MNDSIRKFWPVDTDNEFYIINYSYSLSDIIDAIKLKWGDIPFSNIEITSKYIQTDCIGYDLYDPDDYTSFIKVTKIE